MRLTTYRYRLPLMTTLWEEEREGVILVAGHAVLLLGFAEAGEGACLRDFIGELPGADALLLQVQVLETCEL